LRIKDRNERLLVLCIFLLVIGGWAIATNKNTEVIRETPAQPTILSDSDFRVSGPYGILVVGQTTREEAYKLYPQGNGLGRSGVYRPQGQDILLTFTRKENILNRIDIGVSELSTARGLKANDSFDKVIEKYGSDYTRAYVKNKPQVFDAYYGSEQYILFKVENNVVRKIIIGHPLPGQTQSPRLF